MKPIPIIKGVQLIKILERYGCRTLRSKGSHVRVECHHGKKTTIPVHAGKEVPKGLLRKILYDDLELSEEQVKEMFAIR